MLNEGKHLMTQRRENAFIKVTHGVDFGEAALGTTEMSPAKSLLVSFPSQSTNT